MLNAIRLLALLLLTALPAAGQTATENRRNKFRHELTTGIRGMEIPAGEWQKAGPTILLTPDYSLRFLDRYGVRINWLGWVGREFEWWHFQEPFYEGQIVIKRYAIWDIVPFYSFTPGKRHHLSAGAGYTTRKGSESFIVSTIWYESLMDGYSVRDKGFVGQLSYTYDIGKYLVTSADIAYRSYDRGDPILTAGLKFGVVLRH